MSQALAMSPSRQFPRADATARARRGRPARDEFDWRRVALSWLLCVTYGGVLLGDGVPFWLTAGFYVPASILMMDE